VSQLPFQLARGAAYAVGGILLAVGALLAALSALWVWALRHNAQNSLDGLLAVPLVLAGLFACALAGAGLFFLHRAQSAAPADDR
jgi:hypothetical protein